MSPLAQYTHFQPGAQAPASEKESYVERMFDAVSPSYDLVNRLMSFGLDRSWRHYLVRQAALPPKGSVLDLCTGTGELLLAFGPAVNGIGVDISQGMLEKARAKCRFPNLKFQRASALRLPFPSNRFDRTVSAWALRNVADLKRFFKDQLRVLKSGGKALHLEFSLPEAAWVRLLYLPVLHLYLPLVGGLVSGKIEAYRYLRDTIRNFHRPAEILELMFQTGFRDCAREKLCFGAATLYLGSKP